MKTARCHDGWKIPASVPENGRAHKAQWQETGRVCARRVSPFHFEARGFSKAAKGWVCGDMKEEKLRRIGR